MIIFKSANGSLGVIRCSSICSNVRGYESKVLTDSLLDKSANLRLIKSSHCSLSVLSNYIS